MPTCHMEPRIRIPTPQIIAPTFIVSESAKSCAVVLVSVFVLLLWRSANAQGETGPPGLEGLDEMIVVLAVFPFIAIGLSFFIFRITGKAWAYFLAPFFMAGLAAIGPAEITPDSAHSPDFFIKFAIWAYGAHLLAVAIIYYIFRWTKRSWLFFLAPIVGWIIQFVSLLFILSKL